MFHRLAILNTTNKSSFLCGGTLEEIDSALKEWGGNRLMIKWMIAPFAGKLGFARIPIPKENLELLFYTEEDS